MAYRWHPLYGQQAAQWGAKQVCGQRHVICRLGDGRLYEVPEWMLDEGGCAQHSEGVPQVNLSALHELSRVLQAVGRSLLCDSQGSALPPEVPLAEQPDSSDAAPAASLLCDDVLASRAHPVSGTFYPCQAAAASRTDPSAQRPRTAGKRS